jgi:hypothetical protein
MLVASTVGARVLAALFSDLAPEFSEHVEWAEATAAGFDLDAASRGQLRVRVGDAE